MYIIIIMRKLNSFFLPVMHVNMLYRLHINIRKVFYLFIYFLLKKHVHLQIHSGEHKRGKAETNYTE